MFIDYKLWNSRILGTKAYYQACFMISFNTPVRGMDTTPDMHLDKIYTYLKCVPILVNKQLLIQRLFSGTIPLLIQKISIPSTSRNIWNFFSFWTTFWKLVTFLYAPFPNLMYISHSLNSFYLLNLHRNIIPGGWLENPWLLQPPDSYSTLVYLSLDLIDIKTVNVRVNNVVVVLVVGISNWRCFPFSGFNLSLYTYR